MNLKRYVKKHPQLIAAAGMNNAKVCDAFWVRFTLQDADGVKREFYKPFLAIDQEPSDAPLLIAKHTLEDMEIDLELRPEGTTWRFALGSKKPFIKVDSAKRFRKFLRKSPKVYALIPHNHLIDSGAVQNDTGLPDQLKDFLDVFSPVNAEKLAPNRKDVDLSIELQEGNQPPYGPLYPLSPAELELLREYLERSLAKGFIRPSKSPAGAPILFAPKKDGTLRLCVDYRGLNKVTVKNRYPLPLISEIMDRVNGAKWFSKFDLKDAYHRIRIRPGDEWKTAFRTRYGHFEYLVVPFGLTNAPAAFQAYINHVLRGLVDDFCIVYLDDILIFSKTEEEHTDHLQQICERLRQAELYAKLPKCQFYKKEMEFLGFIITPEGIKMDPQRIQTIQEWKDHPPRSYRDVQVLLGFCNFYRRFIRSYAKLARPLTVLMKGSKNGRKTGNFDKDWGDKQQRAFIKLLDAFLEAPLLRHYDPRHPCRVETDASKRALGAILSQKGEDGLWRPVAFFSRQFKGAELRYGTPDQEMMAIVEAFKHWRHYLEGSSHPIEVLTDHHNLQSFMTQTRLNGRQARWCYYLTPYDFKIKYRTGSTNPADAPSRRPDYMGRELEQAHQGEEDSTLLSTLKGKVEKTSMGRELEQTHKEAVGRELEQAHRGTHKRKMGWELEQAHQEEEDSALLSTLGAKIARVMKVKDLQLRQILVNRIDLDENPGYQVIKSPKDTKLLRRKNKRKQEADHLLSIVKIQKITRHRAREAARNEVPRQKDVCEGLRQLVAASQRDDPFSRRVLKELATPEGTTRAHYSISTDELLLYKRRLYIPQQRSLIHELMYLHHDDSLAGHWGMTKTLKLLQRKFKWAGMKRDVEEYVRTCPTCQVPHHKPYGQLQPLPRPTRPWAEISLDWITQLPPSRRGDHEYTSILTIVDRYTKMAIFLPVKDTMDATDFAEIFYNEVECRFGPPLGVVSDRDSRITSRFWADVCYYSLIKRRLSTAFHPQTDGQSEILNKILENYLRAFTNLEQMNWAKLLPTATFAYNNSFNHTLGMSPFKAMYGYDPDFRVDIADDILGEGINTPAAKDRVKKLHELRETLRDQWVKAQERQEKYYNQRHAAMEFKRGNLVKLSTRNLKLKDKKLQPRYIGPLRVIEKIGSQAYRLALPEKYSRLHDVFPIQLLERYYPREGDTEMPLPDLDEDPDEYEVEEIKDKRLMRGEIHYLIKWTGWPSEYNQWIPTSDLTNAPEAIKAYERTVTKGKKRARNEIEDNPSQEKQQEQKHGRKKQKR